MKDLPSGKKQSISARGTTFTLKTTLFSQHFEWAFQTFEQASIVIKGPWFINGEDFKGHLSD
tara:strand:- start:67 stop:252 length:186 start_codon:yes stop_codon:yes gene_type:complete